MDIARQKFNEPDIPKGDPSYELPNMRWTFDVSRAENELGMTKWIPLDYCVVDLLRQAYEWRKTD